MLPAAPPAALLCERAANAIGNLAVSPPVSPWPSQQLAAAPPPVPARVSQQMAAAPAPAPAQTLRPTDDVPTRPFDQIDGDGDIDVDVDDEVTSIAPQAQAPAVAVAPKLPPPPVAAVPPTPAFTGFGDTDSWYQESRAVVRQEPADELFVETHGVPRAPRNMAVWYVAGAFALGLGIAALLFWPGDGKPGAAKAPAAAAAQPAAQPEPAAVKPTVTPVPAAAPAVTPIPEPVVTPVDPAALPEGAAAPVAAPAAAVDELVPAPTPAPAVAGMVTLSFTSTPSGASVLLVDNGTTLPIGKTPVQLQVAAGKQYQAMFSLDGHPSALVPVDPATSTTVVATLGAAAQDDDDAVVGGPAGDAADEAEAAVAAPPAAQAQAAVADDRGAEKARAAAKRERTAKKAEKRTARAEPAPAAKSGAMGTLKIGAKPPCDIIIDGKRTGLVTPQAALKLSAGKHTITLVNKEHGIKEQLKVTIEAGETTKVIKDLTSRM